MNTARCTRGPAGCPSRGPRRILRVSTAANGQCQRYVE
jgi:hypothetical protein